MQLQFGLLCVLLLAPSSRSLDLGTSQSGSGNPGTTTTTNPSLHLVDPTSTSNSIPTTPAHPDHLSVAFGPGVGSGDPKGQPNPTPTGGDASPGSTLIGGINSGDQHPIPGTRVREDEEKEDSMGSVAENRGHEPTERLPTVEKSSPPEWTLKNEEGQVKSAAVDLRGPAKVENSSLDFADSEVKSAAVDPHDHEKTRDASGHRPPHDLHLTSHPTLDPAPFMILENAASSDLGRIVVEKEDPADITSAIVNLGNGSNTEHISNASASLAETQRLTHIQLGSHLHNGAIGSAMGNISASLQDLERIAGMNFTKRSNESASDFPGTLYRSVDEEEEAEEEEGEPQEVDADQMARLAQALSALKEGKNPEVDESVAAVARVVAQALAQQQKASSSAEAQTTRVPVVVPKTTPKPPPPPSPAVVKSGTQDHKDVGHPQVGTTATVTANKLIPTNPQSPPPTPKPATILVKAPEEVPAPTTTTPKPIAPIDVPVLAKSATSLAPPVTTQVPPKVSSTTESKAAATHPVVHLSRDTNTSAQGTPATTTTAATTTPKNVDLRLPDASVSPDLMEAITVKPMRRKEQPVPIQVMHGPLVPIQLPAFKEGDNTNQSFVKGGKPGWGVKTQEEVLAATTTIIPDTTVPNMHPFMTDLVDDQQSEVSHHPPERVPLTTSAPLVATPTGGIPAPETPGTPQPGSASPPTEAILVPERVPSSTPAPTQQVVPPTSNPPRPPIIPSPEPTPNSPIVLPPPTNPQVPPQAPAPALPQGSQAPAAPIIQPLTIVPILNYLLRLRLIQGQHQLMANQAASQRALLASRLQQLVKISPEAFKKAQPGPAGFSTGRTPTLSGPVPEPRTIANPEPAACLARTIDVHAGPRKYHFSWQHTSRQLFDWFDARNYCRRLCMEPVSPATLTENLLLKNMLAQARVSSGVESSWTSGRLCNTDRCSPLLKSPAFADITWVWAPLRRIIPTTSEVGFHDWAPSASRTDADSQNANCLAITSPLVRRDGDQQWRWTPTSCVSSQHPVVCQDDARLEARVAPQMTHLLQRQADGARWLMRRNYILRHLV